MGARMKALFISNEINQFHWAMLKSVLLVLSILPVSQGILHLWQSTEGSSQIMVEPVADVTAYGVVDCKGVNLEPGESVPMVGVVEKPKADAAPSNLAVVGRYVLSAEIWPLLAKTPPGAGDEIQLTDAIDMLIEKETVEAYHMKGKSHDCGNKLGYMQAFVEYGIRHNTLGEEFKTWLKESVGIKK